MSIYSSPIQLMQNLEPDFIKNHFQTTITGAFYM